VVHHDLHNGAAWLGQQLVIRCSPLRIWLNVFDEMMIMNVVLDQRASLDCFRASSTKQQFVGRHV
jgi:hypothetical protein